MLSHVLEYSSSLTLDDALTSLLSAHDCAALTKPSISAPEKFLVTFDNSRRSTSAASFSFFRIVPVWMLRISSRPSSLGSPISTWTSRRPGRRRASSIISFLFVIPNQERNFCQSEIWQKGIDYSPQTQYILQPDGKINP